MSEHSQTAFTLINTQNGNLAFKLFSFDDNSYFDHLQRNNYYSLVWVKGGEGTVKADFSSHEFGPNTLFSFSPYQPFMFSAPAEIEGIALQFHPDFFCIHKHHQEVACHGVLFNNIYQPPLVQVDAATSDALSLIIEQLKAEMQIPALAQHELLISFLKIILITLSRLKTDQHPEASTAVANLKEPFVLQNLKEAIERDFKTKHSASDYATTLNISPKALAKIVKGHFNKTLTDLISERIIIEAKRELYLTNKAVKQIAYELGYEDEYYFSRFFKVNTDISPQLYRDTVGFDRSNS